MKERAVLVTVSTIPKQDEKHLIEYCGDYFDLKKFEFTQEV